MLPRLSYGYDELEPFLDAHTVRIHHLDYHQSYVDGLNESLRRIGGSRHPEYISSLLSDMSRIPERARDDIAFFGGGFENHRMMWGSIAPGCARSSFSGDSFVVKNSLQNNDNHAKHDASSVCYDDHIDGSNHGNDHCCNNDTSCSCKPRGALADAVDLYFGGFGAFQDSFARTAMSLEGSGWCWLVLDPSYMRLEVMTTANNDSPWMFRRIPLLGLDLWEHAYYARYGGRRERYVGAWWDAVNWLNVSHAFDGAL